MNTNNMMYQDYSDIEVATTLGDIAKLIELGGSAKAKILARTLIISDTSYTGRANVAGNASSIARDLGISAQTGITFFKELVDRKILKRDSTRYSLRILVNQDDGSDEPVRLSFDNI